MAGGHVHMERGGEERTQRVRSNCSKDCLSVPWQLGPVALYLRQYSGLDNPTLAKSISIAAIITEPIELLGKSLIQVNSGVWNWLIKKKYICPRN